MAQIKDQQRRSYINELYLECRSNMEIISEAQYSEIEIHDTVELHNKALLNFMKVKNIEFNFSPGKIKQWVEFQKIMEETGMLADTGNPPQIQVFYFLVIYETQKKMAIWLNMARANSNNFTQ
jgi:hypothetical protein